MSLFIMEVVTEVTLESDMLCFGIFCCCRWWGKVFVFDVVESSNMTCIRILGQAVKLDSRRRELFLESSCISYLGTIYVMLIRSARFLVLVLMEMVLFIAVYFSSCLVFLWHLQKLTTFQKIQLGTSAPERW